MLYFRWYKPARFILKDSQSVLMSDESMVVIVSLWMLATSVLIPSQSALLYSKSFMGASLILLSQMSASEQTMSSFLDNICGQVVTLLIQVRLMIMIRSQRQSFLLGVFTIWWRFMLLIVSSHSNVVVNLVY